MTLPRVVLESVRPGTHAPPGFLERHEDPAPVCRGQWCCGCAVHPVGKPWGWNFEAWEQHYAEVHREA